MYFTKKDRDIQLKEIFQASINWSSIVKHTFKMTFQLRYTEVSNNQGNQLKEKKVL